MTERQTILITSPLEAEHVATLRAVDPARLEVLYEDALMPRTRYIADHKGAPFVREGAALQRWQALLGQADILFDLPRPEDLPHATRLRWVQTTSTGVGQAAARLGLQQRGIVVTTARGVHARPLAEFVFMALLAHFRGLRQLQEEQRAHRWVVTCNEEIAGRTLVTIGAGDLARGCATIARALAMRTIAVARDPARVRAHNTLFDQVVPSAELHAALAQADAVVVTVPHTPDTEQMIDARAFAAMPRGVAFVNIGRGVVVDEAAMIAALRDGQVGYAALDVATVEPLPADSPLWDMPNVLISPHSASTVTAENARIVGIFAENLKLWLDGRVAEMRNLLDYALMY
jgi:phosphoglycerate dehydrogenase-like enzyme